MEMPDHIDLDRLSADQELRFELGRAPTQRETSNRAYQKGLRRILERQALTKGKPHD